MPNQLQNICVLIEDENEVRKAIRLVKKYGFDVSSRFFNKKGMDYFGITKGKFFLGFRAGRDLITLTELEKLLEYEKPNP